MTMHHTDEGANWLSTTEVARMLVVSEVTVRGYVKRGLLRCAPRRDHSPYRIDPESVRTFRRSYVGETRGKR